MKKPGILYITMVMALSSILFSCEDLLPLEETDYVDEKYDVSGQDLSASSGYYTTSNTPLLTWKLGMDMVSYEFQLADDDSFSPLLEKASGLTETQYQVSTPLTEIGRYSWRIRGTTKEGSKTRWYVFHFAYLDSAGYESFEVHDGTFSTLHDWTLERDNSPRDEGPSLFTDSAYHGEYAAELPEDTSISTKMVVEADSMVTFQLAQAATLEIYLDGSRYSYVEFSHHTSSWGEYSFYLEAGTYDIEWKNDYFSDAPLLLDDIRLAPLPYFSNAFEEWDESTATINSYTRGGDRTPYIDTSQSSAGLYSVIFGVQKTTGESSFSVDVTFPQDTIVSYDFKRSEDGADLYFRVDETTLLNTRSTASDWTTVSFIITAGTHTLQWVHDKYHDQGERAWIDNIQASPLPDFSHAFEEWDESIATINSYTRGGDKAPYIDTTQSSAGLYSVLFGVEGSTGESSFSADVTFPQDTIVSFDYKRSESGANLYFRVDDIPLLNTTTTASDWTTVSFIITAGTHTLQWEHDKYYDQGERAWIDNIQASPLPDFSYAFEEWDESIASINSYTQGGTAEPYCIPAPTSSGLYSVIFGEEESSGNSSFSANMTFPQDTIVSFDYKRSESGANLYFRVDDTVLLDTTSYASDWTTVSFVITAGTHSLQWEHDKYYDQGERAWIDNIRGSIPAIFNSDGFETNDGTFSTLNDWTLSGDATPFIQSTTVNTGSYAVEFGDIDDNGQSAFSTDIAIASDSILTFSYKVSSESSLDKLSLYINDTKVFYDSGSVDWTTTAESLSAGLYTLRWVYTKDGSVSLGSDTAWVDDITIAPY